MGDNMDNMPTHSCKQHFQRLLDMIIYLSKYIPNMSELTAALRSLLKGDVSWVWFPEHDSALTNIKTVLSSAPVLRFYDTSLSTTLQVDASKDGLGACLICTRPTSCICLTCLVKFRDKLPPIEKEMLAIVFGCERDSWGCSGSAFGS